MNRPSRSNVQFLDPVTDLTLSKVCSVRLPQLIQSFFGQRHFKAAHKVITVQQRSRAVQTGIARTDGGEFQRLKALPFAQVNAAVLRIGIADVYRREHIMPQIFAVLVQYSQTFIVHTAHKRVAMAACKDRFIRDFPSQPCEVEDCEGTLARSRRKRDCQQVQFVISQILQRVCDLLQHLSPRHIKLLLRFSGPFHIL